MTRKMTLVFSAALILTLTSLMQPGSASAQTQSYYADTGFMVLSAGQTLRLTAANITSEAVTVRFKKTEYVDSSSTGLIIRKQPVQTISDSITLLPGQSAAIDFQYTIKDIRGEAVSSSKNVRLNAFVISPAPTGSTGGSNGSSILPMEQISFNFTNITFEYFQ